MKKWGILVVLLCCGIMVNAAKVALIPAAPELSTVADQVLAEMSKDSGIEFLERADIETILKERKLTAAGLTGTNLIDLGKTIHADLFAVITAKPVPKGKVGAAVSGLIVYDARNGFRLVNATLSEQDAVKEIIERLRRAQDITKHPEKQILLSIVTVRDAGVPERFKYQQALIAAEFDRQLSSIPGVVMLERDYLDSVTNERQITGQMFALTPSARLLRLEFSPTDSSDKIVLTVRMTDVTGKEQARYKIDDAFSSPDDTVKSMITNLAGQLKLAMPPAKIATGKLRLAEAARFYEEYSFLLQHGDYDAAESKLQTAIALFPNKPQYRLAMISLLEKCIGKQPILKRDFNFDKVFSKAEMASQICDEVHRDFPKYNKSVYGMMTGLLMSLTEGWRYANNHQRQRVIKFVDTLRPKIQNEALVHFKFDLSDGINSIDELENYRKYLFRSCRFWYYFNDKKYSDALLERGLEILQLSADFFIRNPLLIPEDIDRQYEIIAGEFGFPLGRDDSSIVQYLVLNAQNYIEAAKKHPLKAANCIGYTLELCRKTALSNYDETVFRSNMQKYCRTIDALHISHIPENPREDNSCSRYQYFLERTQPNLLKTADQIAASQLQSVIPIEKLLRDVASEENLDLFAQKVTAVIPQLKQLRPQIFNDPKISFYPDIFANKLYYGIGRKNENCRQALELLMDGTQITQLLAVEKLLIPDGELERTAIKSAAWSNGSIYLLVWTPLKKSSQLSVIKFDHESKSVQQINHIAGLPTYIYPITYLGQWIFSVSENYAMIALNESLFLLPLNGSTITELKDFQGKTVNAATELDGRIYVFSGKINKALFYPQETVLISCLPDGSDRKTHVSTLREDKQNILDKKPFIVNAAFSDAARKRILFVAQQPPEINGLWEFYPEAGKFNKIIRGGVLNLANKISNTVFFASRRNYYSFDCRNNQIENHFAIIYSDSVKSTNAKTILEPPGATSRGFDSLFLVQGNRLCLISESRLLMCPPGKLEQSPFIFLPGVKEFEIPSQTRYQSKLYLLPFRACNIFPHPDGVSVIVVGSDSIYKVTPQQDKKINKTSAATTGGMLSACGRPGCAPPTRAW